MLECIAESTVKSLESTTSIAEEILLTVPATSSLIPPNEMKSTPIDFDPFVDGEILLTAPATESQQEIWLGVQISDESNLACLLSQQIELTGRFELEIFRRSIALLIERHESLRTTFSSDGTQILIAKQLDYVCPFIDLSGLDAAERDLEVASYQQQAVNEKFDLQRGSLFSFKILKLAERQHLVIFTIHHIICDGWSLGIIINELAKIYTALSKGLTPDLQPSEYFSEHAFAEADKLDSTERKEIEAYWLQRFESLPPIVELPADRPRPPQRTFNSERVYHTLSADLVRSIESLGVINNSSLLTTLLAAFEIFLAKLTGQTDLVVGLPTAGQLGTGKFNLVGHCVNFLPVRSNIDPQMKFSDYLRSRNREILDDYDNQDFTFGSLLKKLSIPRDPSRMPLVAAAFNLDLNNDSDRLKFGELDVEISVNPGRFYTFEFFLNGANASNGEIDFDCQYNTNLYDRQTIERRLVEFEHLLTEIVADPDRQIHHLSLLSPQQRQQITIEWNATQSDTPCQPLHQLFAERAAQIPDTIAVVCGDRQLTYGELNARSNQLARHLQALGAKPDALVGIYIERSLEILVGLLGILKAGAAYVPLDPSYPAERLNYMVADAGVEMLVTEQALLDSLPAAVNSVICLDADWQTISERNATDLPLQSTPDHLAYVIYTSGSTGKPKGVQICHRTVTNFLAAMCRTPGLTAADVMFSVTTISFDIAVLELYLPLLVGAKIVLASREISMDGKRLLQLLASSRATVMQATPTTWQLLLAAGWEGKLPLKILCGGEALSPDLAARLCERGESVWNLYGPTEATVWATISRVDRSDLNTIAIGRPLGNVRVYILDPNLQPVPIGVSGELHIGGDCLARGYLNRPDLTAVKFIPDPFSADPTARLYKTGDLAKYLPDGNIECLGRIDNQVKIRGFRIELGEIEAAIAQSANVREVCVIAREDRPGDKRLVAYIIEGSTRSTATELREFLRSRLPNYLIPSAFVSLDTLPLTANGKIDRRALPAPAVDLQESDRTRTLVAPRDEIESQLVAIWQRVLGLESIGIRDNFFELGGNSLLAVRLFNEIEKTFGKNISLSTLFQAQTIEELAVFFSPQAREASIDTWQSLIQIKSGNPSKSPLFCIHALWGNILFYRDFSQYLKTDRAMYGLQSRGLDGDQQPCVSIPEMAANYIKEIQTVQPQGPYFLLGYSMGGSIAFEIALQLQAQGQEVRRLMLIDPTCPNLTTSDLGSNEIPDDASLLTKTAFHLQALQKLKWSDKKTYVVAKVKYNFTVGKSNTLYKLYLRYIKQSTNELYQLDVVWANDRSRKIYVPQQQYSGKIVLFKAEDPGIGGEDFAELKWELLATKGVEIVSSPGSHLNMMEEPHIRTLSAKFDLYLNKE